MNINSELPLMVKMIYHILNKLPVMVKAVVSERVALKTIVLRVKIVFDPELKMCS